MYIKIQFSQQLEKFAIKSMADHVLSFFCIIISYLREKLFITGIMLKRLSGKTSAEEKQHSFSIITMCQIWYHYFLNNTIMLAHWFLHASFSNLKLTVSKWHFSIIKTHKENLLVDQCMTLKDVTRLFQEMTVALGILQKCRRELI